MGKYVSRDVCIWHQDHKNHTTAQGGVHRRRKISFLQTPAYMFSESIVMLVECKTSVTWADVLPFSILSIVELADYNAFPINDTIRIIILLNALVVVFRAVDFND